MADKTEESISKYARVESRMGMKGEVDKDWISKMPDCILSSIISLLTMREAVRTSALSTRWKYLWVSSFKDLNFDELTVFESTYPFRTFYRDDFFLDCRQHISEENYKLRARKFVGAVDQFMSALRAPKIETFRVCYNLGNEYTHYLDQWICAAITAQVETLDFDFYKVYTNFSDIERYSFDCRLLGSCGKKSSLRELHLAYCILTLPTDFGGFSALKTICLADVVVQDKDVDNIVSKSSLLESLLLIHCRKLSDLKIVNSQLKYFKWERELPLKALTICAENLVTFDYNGYFAPKKIFTVKNVHRLVDTTFKIFSTMPFSCLRFIHREFSNQLPQLETLVLHSYDVNKSKMEYFPQSLPTFSNLKQLTIFDNGKAKGANIIWGLFLLKASPFLQKFYLKLGCVPKDPSIGVGEMMPPNCAHYHLKEVTFYNFKWCKNEVELATYVLDNAMVLVKIRLNSHSGRYHDGTSEMHTDYDDYEDRPSFIECRERKKKFLPSIEKKLEAIPRVHLVVV